MAELFAREGCERLLGAVHAAIHEIAAAGDFDREQVARLVELHLEVGARNQRGADAIARNHRLRAKGNVLVALALELLRGTVTSLGFDELGLCAGEVDRAVLALEHLARALARCERLGLVELPGM
jgi:hypothetical protein